MPEHSAPERTLPLKSHLRQGRYGAMLPQGPGVRLGVRHPLSIVTIIARKEKEPAVSAALEAHYGLAAPNPRRMTLGQGLALLWCGDQQYYAIAEGRGEGGLHAELKERLQGLASLSDQSHGRVVIAVSGPKARALLAKGSAIDFHRREFPVNSSAPTQMAHIGVHVSATSEDGFELSLFRAFSEHFWEWLTEQASEFGYEVI
ncbi:MAG TPA: sarcosine oxidase subunit gamma family protein [Aestuariivirgaceae bacterium]|jgi:sarcosine oxidase subunit gamma